MSTPATPVVGPVPDATLEAATAPPGSLLAAITDDPDALVYVLLNVGDGDTQLLVLPADGAGRRRLVVVDVATPGKLPGLLDALHDAGVIEAPGTAGQIRLLVASHPHFDHIGGMTDLLDHYRDQPGCIEEFWDPGYYFPNPSFHNLMAALESTRSIRRLQPTSGLTVTLDTVRLTVLGPGIGLRTRFDTYGVEINDSSITLMVDYPAAQVFTEPAAEGDRDNRRPSPQRSRRLLLGADAQFTSWAQTAVDFPDLQQTQNPALAKELRTARGRDYLSADLVKLSHHGSKHGVNLEVLERVDAPLTLVSSVAGGGKYGFPHLLAMEAAREARQATTTKGTARQSDQQLGIHVTGATLDGTGAPAGSIAVLVPRAATAPLRLFRLMDGPSGQVELTAAREVRR